MIFKRKILPLDMLYGKVSEWKKNGMIIVLCHGNFNVVHPGHLRFLEFAKKHGSILVVTVCGDDSIVPESSRNYFFNEEERSQGVAAVEFVDIVSVIDGTRLFEVIENIKPDFYIKGKEFENEKEGIKEEIEAVRKVGGQIIYGSGDVRYSCPELFFVPTERVNKEEKELFYNACKRHNIRYSRLISILNEFASKKMLIIGDTIVDQYVACDPLGLSSEAPVPVIRELESKEFLGGAGIVACHLNALGADCTFISVVGNDTTNNFVRSELGRNKITGILFEDNTRPTTYKIRYIVDNHKLLRVSRLKDHSIYEDIEDKVINELKKQIQQVDGVVICDFSYGVITNRIVDTVRALSKEYNVKVFADLQCSSQIGDVTKFKEIELITPTEREARIALNNKEAGLERLGYELLMRTGNKSVVVTLGEKGLIAFGRKAVNGRLVTNSQYFPALTSSAIDPAGAGDALLSVMSLSLCCGANIMESAALGSCMGALEVKKLGNVTVTLEELKNYLTDIMKDMSYC